MTSCDDTNYIPIQKILRNNHVYSRNYWMYIIKSVERYFVNNQLPNLCNYDLNNDFKIDRSILFSKDSNFENCTILKKHNISDHKILSWNDLHTWNILHHYSYNKSHDYLSLDKIRQSDPKIYQLKIPIPEDIRYNEIIRRITEYLKFNRNQCFALQECEFYIYKKLVDILGKKKYSSRFIPHKITYDKFGLHIESYGCAIFLYDNLKEKKFYVKGYLKENQNSCEMSYKFIILKNKDEVYVSIHFPCYRNEINDIWTYYFHIDISTILSSFRDIKVYNFLGDLNIKKEKIQKLLKDYNTNYQIDYIYEGVDYIMKWYPLLITSTSPI